MASKQPGDAIPSLIASQQSLERTVRDVNDRLGTIAAAYDQRLAKLAADISASDVAQLNARLDAQGDRFNDIDTKITEARGLMQLILDESAKKKEDVAQEILAIVKDSIQESLDEWAGEITDRIVTLENGSEAITALAQRVQQHEDSVSRQLAAINGKLGQLKAAAAAVPNRPERPSWLTGKRISVMPNPPPYNPVVRKRAAGNVEAGISLPGVTLDIVRARPGILFEDLIVLAVAKAHELGATDVKGYHVREGIERLFGKGQLIAET